MQRRSATDDAVIVDGRVAAPLQTTGLEDDHCNKGDRPDENGGNPRFRPRLARSRLQLGNFAVLRQLGTFRFGFFGAFLCF